MNFTSHELFALFYPVNASSIIKKLIGAFGSLIACNYVYSLHFPEYHLNRITLFLFFCIISQSLFPQWVLQEQVFDDIYLKDVFFYDNLNGWVVGSKGTILHTSDGGDNWNIQNSGVDAELSSVIFCSPLIGWVSGSNGYILKTTNGGTDWNIKREPIGVDYTNIFFLNLTTGWAVNTYWDTLTYVSTNSIIKSTNGGDSWVTQVSNFSENIKDIYFFNSSKGVLSTFSRGQNAGLWFTSDGGDNWKLTLKSYPYSIVSFSFVNDNTGWAVGSVNNDRIVYKTTNGGESWTSQKINFNTYVQDIFFIDELNGWILGYEESFYTSDGGNTWINQVGSGIKIFFSDKEHGWILGNSGEIYNYSNDKSISLLGPGNSDELMPNYRYLVWFAANLVDQTRADYSTDNGYSWINIQRNIPAHNFGSLDYFAWKLNPDLHPGFLLRLMDESDSDIFDIKQCQMEPLSFNQNRTNFSYFVEGQKFNKIVVEGNYAYISALENGIYIYDISNPYQPVFIKNFQTAGWAQKSFYEDGRLYVAEASAGLSVYNVLDPSSISLIGKYVRQNGSVSDVYVEDSLAVVFYSGLRILNIKDPSNITEVSNLTANDYDLLYADLPYIYAARENNLDIIHVSDSENPVVLSTINVGSEKVLSVAAEGNILTIGGYSSIRNFDVSDKSNPQLRSFYINTSGQPEETWIMMVTDIIVENNTVYAADNYKGLNVFAPVDSTEMRINKFFRIKIVPWGHYSGEFSGLAKKDSVLYLTDKENGLYIISVTDTPVSVNEEILERVLSFGLEQNYPNPFNPSTTIRYTIPDDAGLITLKIYDILGNEIAFLVNEEKPAGIYEITFDAANLSTGIYLCKLQTGKYSEVKKLILMK